MRCCALGAPVTPLVICRWSPSTAGSRRPVRTRLAVAGSLPPRLRGSPPAWPLPRAIDGRIMLAVDVSPWLRSDAATSADRLFGDVYGRGQAAPS